MDRWTLELGRGLTCFVQADGWGVVIDDDGEAMEINTHQHGKLFVMAIAHGIKSRVREEEATHE